MKLTVKHYYSFKGHDEISDINVDNPDAWDKLRLEGKDSNQFYAMPKARSQWIEKTAADGELKRKAEDIGALTLNRFNRVNSYGVGNGGLEYLLKLVNPELYIQCSDYTPKSIEYLKAFFKEADEIVLFDMIKDAWVNVGDHCLYVLFGVDSAFADEQLDLIFSQMSKAGIGHVLFVPCGVLTFKILCRQKAKYLIYRIFHKPFTFVGYLRTLEKLISLFWKYYEIEKFQKIGQNEGFLLALRKAKA
jgi:hypothetical protein